ncbi:hypothetical protein F5Y07DRAFT_212440 [Xylaria sp. FL0933]|nr:hypothetical protein F5Y07DRAFT_212440 [Xylaria sp. FL0933]
MPSLFGVFSIHTVSRCALLEQTSGQECDVSILGPKWSRRYCRSIRCRSVVTNTTFVFGLKLGLQFTVNKGHAQISKGRRVLGQSRAHQYSIRTCKGLLPYRDPSALIPGLQDHACMQIWECFSGQNTIKATSPKP